MIRGMTTPANLTSHIGVPLGRPPRIAVAGAGGRGSTYAALAAGSAEIVAVAEPRAHHRRAFTERHASVAVHENWQDMLAAGRVADAVIIATQDADHVAAATAFAAGPQFRRGLLAAARGRPMERHGGLQRKEAEVAKGL